MTPDVALQMYQNLINENGQAISIRRYVGIGAGRSATDVVTQGYVNYYQAQQIIGSVVQGDKEVIVLVDSLNTIVPITTRDFVVINGKESSIKNPMPRVVGGVLIAFALHCSGG